MLEISQPSIACRGSIDTEFADAVFHGLSKQQKTLPYRYFYDARGSDLFEMITELPEYYLTRSEAALLESNAEEITRSLTSRDVLVEFGAGSSRKMDLLLHCVPAGATFVPIDVSRHALIEARERLASKFPSLTLRPIVDDFSSLSALPEDLRIKRKLDFFLGSTIGNLDPDGATALLRGWRSALGFGAQLLIGADVLKDEKTLLNAYNDAAGVTGEFNLNILARINREFGQAFDLSAFEHSAVFNPIQSRIEMHLVSPAAQTVRICGRTFKFATGESVHTENSYKHSQSAFRAIVQAAGWHTERVWTDGLFSLYRLA